jgi:hypothetical protein
MDVEKLVFIDETWTSTSMTRRCGRAPKGKRCIASALEDDYLCGCTATPPIDRTDGH